VALVPVILSGGAGTRLWPLSRELQPKQLLPLTSGHSMLQETLLRLQGLAAAAPVIVCNEAHRFLVAEQLRELALTPRATLLEPFGRNTAPAIALAAHAVLAGAPDGEPLLLVLPADHLIQDVPAFHAAVRTALAAAAAGRLATFGIVPRSPETGYGYIQRGEPSGAAFRIARFVEKPDAERAAGFLAAGDYYWNSGMFLLGARHYLSELGRFAPRMAEVCAAAFAAAVRDADFTRIDRGSFEACPSDSIDYAVMEKTADAVVVPLEAGWSDVGSWAALHEAGAVDAHGNVTRGDVIAEDTADSYLHAGSRLVATVGLRDHVVVETADAVLVAPRARVQDVKKLVQQLKDRGRHEHLRHPEQRHGWGSSQVLASGNGLDVLRVRVAPGGVVPRHSHPGQAVHWVVTAGEARVTCGSLARRLARGEALAMDPGVEHQLENPGATVLEIVEVRCPRA